MSNQTVISGIQSTVDTLLSEIVFEGYAALAGYLQSALGLILALVVAWLGYGLMTGKVETPASVLIEKAIKIALVSAFAVNWDLFNETIYAFIHAVPDRFVEILLAQHPTGIVGKVLHGMSEGDVLQQLLVKGMSISTEMLGKGGLRSPAALVMGLLCMLNTLLIVGYALVFLLLSKLGTAICIVLAPLFITLVLFSTSQGMTNRWLQQLGYYTLLPVCTTCVLFFVMAMMTHTFENHMETLSFTSSGLFTLLGIITLPMLKQAAQFAGMVAEGIQLPGTNSGGSGHFSLGSALKVPHQAANQSKRALHKAAKSVKKAS